MKFSSPSDNSGLCEDTDRLVGTTTTTYSLVDKAASANNWLDYVVGVILQSDTRWQWDDINNSDLPIGTTNLVDGQQDYEIAGGTFLRILRVEVMDNNGNYQKLDPIDMRDIPDQALSEFLKTSSMPLFYDKFGNSLFLYPKPSAANVTLSNGLKVYFQRGASYFTASDTTKTPGFANTFHRLISLGMALDYADANDYPSQKIARLQGRFDKLEFQLIAFYQTRERDTALSMSLQREHYGQGYKTTSEKSVSLGGGIAN